MNNKKGQPLHVKLMIPKRTETSKPVKNAESTEEASPDNSLPTAVELEVMKKKNTRMCYIGMIKESCYMKTNQSQVLMWST